MQLIPCALALFVSLQNSPSKPPHRLDGRFDDWAQLDPIATQHDPTGDSPRLPDVVTLSLASDANDFWMYLEFAEPLTIEGLELPLQFLIDSDGNPNTGAQQGRLPGADLAIVCSPAPADAPRDAAKDGPPPSKEHGEGVAVYRLNDDGSLGAVISSSSIGLGIAPSHASKRYEFRIPRTAERFGGMSAAVRTAVVQKLDAKTTQYPDEFDTARVLLVPRAKTPPSKVEVADIARPKQTTLRVASWNAELGGLFKTPEPFGATLKALAPDVVLFQELGAKATADELAAWMNANVGSEAGEWHAIVSGGDLRTGIVSQRGLTAAPFLDGVKRPAAKGDRPVRVSGAVLDLDGSPILLASLHLKCCGRFQSPEDETRLAEAAAIHDAITQAKEKSTFAGIVIAGDFNLVGDPAVVTRISDGLDIDGSSLQPIDAFQPDGVSNATWRSSGNRFVPGRLDWLLVSDASVNVVNSFIFNTDIFSAAAIEAMKLPPSALKEPSDHMPVVADLVLQKKTPEPKK